MSGKGPEGWFPEGEDPARYDPVRAARQAMRPGLPKRFYAEASVGEGDGLHHLLLDGRRARTPARRPLALQSRQAAELLAAEWAAQGEVIDPATMPVTRIAHAALDFVGEAREATAAEIARYAESDLLVYRAADPARLVERQRMQWDPVLDWVAQRYGARFTLAEGIRFEPQPPAALASIRAAVEAIDDPVRLSALHVMTTVGGSVLLALAAAEGFIDADAAFAAAELDADVQRELWGADEEAEAAREARRRDMLAALGLWQALAADRPAD